MTLSDSVKSQSTLLTHCVICDMHTTYAPARLRPSAAQLSAERSSTLSLQRRQSSCKEVRARLLACRSLCQQRSALRTHGHAISAASCDHTCSPAHISGDDLSHRRRMRGVCPRKIDSRAQEDASATSSSDAPSTPQAVNDIPATLQPESGGKAPLAIGGVLFGALLFVGVRCVMLSNAICALLCLGMAHTQESAIAYMRSISMLHVARAMHDRDQ
jgi:hypothetical protein